MKSSFDEALIEVWRQALVGNVATIDLDGRPYPVRRTQKRGLRQVDFVFGGKQVRGLEQNPDTQSRWAQLARSGKKVMQFLCEGQYVAVVVDGKVKSYGSAS
ncbi:MAG TPA: pyridoxamine 5'-phosphate oxidase family protein [Candidatus Acidoferrum sp.]|nr:pyridoxamine 5'-phosphate oxidase family protein [Candidatus Acidoferrum sp.]